MRRPDRLVLVVLLFPTRMAALAPYAKAIYDAVAANPLFAGAAALLAELAAAITGLLQASAACETRAKGTAAARREKVRVLKAVLKALAQFVQRIVNANPDNALVIVQSAGMHAKKVGVHETDELTAIHGENSGEVEIRARRVAREAAYEWQYSTDQKTWNDAGRTMQARMVIRDLTPGVVYYFRFRALTRKGEGDWSQVVWLHVT